LLGEVHIVDGFLEPEPNMLRLRRIRGIEDMEGFVGYINSLQRRRNFEAVVVEDNKELCGPFFRADCEGYRLKR